MKYSIGIPLLSLSLALLMQAPDNALAEDASSNSCDISCPAEQKVVSFTDGDNAACVCAPETDMVPTEPDPSMATSGGYEDEGQKE